MALDHDLSHRPPDHRRPAQPSPARHGRRTGLNKDEIVRELYAQLVAAYDGLWGAGDGGLVDLSPEEVLAHLAEGAALSGRYAFLARDLLGLLHADPMLAVEYTAVRARRIAEFTGLALAWRARGVIGPLDDASVTDLVQALWLIAETWLAFGELDGDRTDAEDGTRLLRVVLRPYLTPDGRSTGQSEDPGVPLRA